MVDQVASPEEKLWLRAKQAEEFGKEFDEEKERRILKLPDVPKNREPIFLAEDRNRTQLTLREDRDALQELVDARDRAAHASVGDALDEKQTEIDALKQQVAELLAQSRGEPMPSKPQKEPTDIGTGPGASHDHPEGKPDKTWAKAKLRNFMKHYDIPEPAGGSNAMSNTGLLDYVLTEGEKLELFETTAPKDEPEKE